jgi:hypothetical protein
MSSQLTHERCSELLADYLADALDPEQHRLVEDHLEHCAQCSAERAGLAALNSAGEGEGLTGDERSVLRAAVLDAAGDSTEPSAGLRSGRALPKDESDAVVVPLGRRRSRAGQYLGIAAMLAILAVGFMIVSRGGGLGVTGSNDDAGSGGGAELSTEEDSDRGVAAGAPTPAQGRFEYAQDLRPRFGPDSGAISDEDLDRLGRQGATLFKNSETALDESGNDEPTGSDLRSALRASQSTLERLASQAPDSLAPDVTECGRTGLQELGEVGLASYATTATLEGEDIIVVAFVTGSRTPKNYAVFAFPRRDCTTILARTEGPLE